MYYYKANIPRMSDGRLVVPKDWYGEFCGKTHDDFPKYSEARNLLYNEKEGYLIAQTESETIIRCAETGQCKLLTKEQVDKELENPDILIGDELAHRWDEVENAS